MLDITQMGLTDADTFGKLLLVELTGTAQQSNIEHNNVQVSLKLLVRSANVLGCTLETLLDRKAAAEWAQAHDAEADEQAGAKSNSVPETAAAETDEQEQYSLEEVRLLLKLLQLSKGR